MYQPAALAMTGGVSTVAVATGLQLLWLFVAVATVVLVVSALGRLLPRREA